MADLNAPITNAGPFQSGASGHVATHNELADYVETIRKAIIGRISIGRIPGGSTLTVVKTGSTWPARPTGRTDIVVQWKGPDPSPAIVASGTGGMLDNVDIRLVTP